MESKPGGAGMKPRLKLVGGEPVQVKPASPAVEKARERFGAGRKFIHELGTDFLRYPEPVLSRWARKADWRNVRHGGQS